MNKCSLKNGGQRPKAWIGAAITIASTLAGLYNNYRNRQLQTKLENKRIDEENELTRHNNLVSNLSNFAKYNTEMSALEDQYLQKEKDNLIAKSGAKISLKDTPFKIDNGGYAIPLNNHTFLLRGRSHANGGIDITFGNKNEKVPIEAEGGEVVTTNNPRSAMIYSKRMRLSNGLTPAQSILAGYNERAVAVEQQLRNGNHRSTPVKGNIHKAYAGDWINLGADLATAIGTGLINRNAYNKLNTKLARPKFVEELPVVLDTTYNNSAQLASLNRMRLAGNKAIGENTSSSAVAQARMRLNNLDYALKGNELLDYKTNQEIALRNAQKELEQGVRTRNTAAKNAWYQQYVDSINKERELENNRTLMRGQNWSTTLAGINRAGTNLSTALNQQKQDENTLLALMASSNPGSVETFISNGGSFGKRSDARIYNSLKEKNEINLMNTLYNRFNPLQKRLYKIG